MNFCKTCKNQTKNKFYCSNHCKFIDPEWKKSRARSLLKKNDQSKRIQCKKCSKLLKDINNIGGQAVKHLEVHHGIIDPEYTKYYNIVEYSDNAEYLQCPHCDWKTKDLSNKSGQFTVHLKKFHGITDINKFTEEYPIFKRLWSRLEILNRDRDDKIICKVCNVPLSKISNTHLKLHGITMDEYKKKFPFQPIINNRLHEVASNIAKITNANRKYTYRSKAEYELENFLKSNNVTVIPSFKLNGTEIDLYIPDHNLGIEFNGLRYHSENFGNKNKTYHLNKTNICNESNIRLIHIFEDEWIYKKEIVLSKLKNVCKVTTSKIHTRKCIIKVIGSKESSEFCNKNHIQGASKGFLHLGLFYNGDLVGVFVLSKLRKSLGSFSTDKTFEINRFCTKLNTLIPGAFSKFLKYVQINFKNIKELISYADLRWSDKHTNVYEKSNFTLESTSGPNYWYISGNRRLHRFNFTKFKIVQLGGDKNKSEIENMLLAGYDRIWDCGNLKYKLILN